MADASERMLYGVVSHTLRATRSVLDQVLAAAESDPRLRSLIGKDYARIVAFKQNRRGPKQASAAIFGDEF